MPPTQHYAADNLCCAAWHLDRVEVTRLPDGPTTTFPCGDWIGADGAGEVSRRLEAAPAGCARARWAPRAACTAMAPWGVVMPQLARAQPVRGPLTRHHKPTPACAAAGRRHPPRVTPGTRSRSPPATRVARALTPTWPSRWRARAARAAGRTRSRAARARLPAALSTPSGAGASRWTPPAARPRSCHACPACCWELQGADTTAAAAALAPHTPRCAPPPTRTMRAQAAAAPPGRAGGPGRGHQRQRRAPLVAPGGG